MSTSTSSIRRAPLAGLALLLALLAAACGGQAASAPPTPPPVEAPPEAIPAADEGAGGAGGGEVTTLDDVSGATVQIVAEGTFVDPEFGLQLNVAGSGSGFIIDPSGIAVTNNHVVTGSALLRVYVGGEDEPRNAKVLGYSECSDLAVIDIDGEGYPYFAWHDGETAPGLDVYAAGYPLGDPEFTLTRGIVSKARTDGESDWASVDEVLEHDATINPGNSGGPLVTDTGRVVGVNYAGSSFTSQYFAINAADAGSIIDQLRGGRNVNSIGVNGQAVSDEEGLSGIWVASVASGSPADKAGVRAGDIITSLEGLALATDGTMADFCDILRSRNATDTMAIEVLRYDTEEYLTGQLNGDALELAFSFAAELEAELAMEGGADSYADYAAIADDTGSISVEVPAEWADIDGAPFDYDGNEILDLVASTDVDAFWETWTTAGARISASTDLARTHDEHALLELMTDGLKDECVFEGRYEYDDGLYSGWYELFTDCGGEDTTYVALGAVDGARSVVIGVQVQIIEPRDLEALDHILGTFIVS